LASAGTDRIIALGTGAFTRVVTSDQLLQELPYVIESNLGLLGIKGLLDLCVLKSLHLRAQH
jgi:hypothetical protein